MNLNFALLEGTTHVPPVCNDRGHAGTLGTPAIMRVPEGRRAGDAPGTPGDEAVISRPHAGLPTRSAGAALMQCPRMYPSCPLFGNGHEPKEIKASPMSPLVPGPPGANAFDEDFDPEAFEERAAIMEFEGGLTRADAEVAARRCLSVSHIEAPTT